MRWSDLGLTHDMTFESGSKDIWVDYGRRRGRHTPFVKGLKKCGRPARFMKLTPEYIMDADVARPYGPYGKVLLFITVYKTQDT